MNPTQMQALFLSQSLADGWADYCHMCQRRNAKTWDDVIITASNEAQAEAYRLQLAWREEQGLLPRQTRYHVSPDPGGRRVGSGGATLHLIKALREAPDAPPFAERRILVLHSGGDSQRVPQYSACGKLFSRVPRLLPDGRASTLFDEFLIALAGVPSRMAGGMLILSGDVLLVFHTLQVDLDKQGAACLSIKAPAELGTRHGVFLADDQGQVRRFLHKQPASVLRDLGAVNAQGAVNIDTGAIWLGSAALEALYGLVATPEGYGRYVNERVRLSFYGDFLFPMAAEATLESYLAEPAEGESGPALDACRQGLWNALRATRLTMSRLSPARFIHFGTTSELVALMLAAAADCAHLNWKRSVLSVGVPEDAAGVNSQVDSRAQVGAGCYLEDSRIGAGARIGAGCVVSQADLQNGELPPGTALSVLPLADGHYVARVYAVSDNPKARLGDTSFKDFLVPPEALFGPGEETLWQARLYPIADSMAEAIEAALLVLRLRDGYAEPEALSRWSQAERLSLRGSFELASVPSLLAWQQELEDTGRVALALDALAEGRGFERARTLLSQSAPPLDRQIRLLKADVEASEPPLRYRLEHALSHLCRDEAYETACFETINRLLYESARRGSAPRRMCRESADVALPVRVNFGGGWSDTPPYCLEHGGTVLNAAVLLRGERPMRAWARRINKPVVCLYSEDADLTQEFTDHRSLGALGNPHDPFALGKSVLAACGLTPLGATGPIDFDAMGGGLLLGTASRLPRGSGLGGSSILTAAAVRALQRLFGQDEGSQRVMELTLCAEQLMSTGGGWQDQAGALYPGVKLINSRPGVEQRLDVRCLDLSEGTWAALDERLSLVYTGQRRLARNILREIVGKVIDVQRETQGILTEIQRLAVLMAYELERGELARFGRLLSEHWTLSKALDPGSTNTCIDQMIDACADLNDGVMICGAGGGGFLTMLRKQGVSEAALEQRLEQVFQDSGVAVWRCNLMRGVI